MSILLLIGNNATYLGHSISQMEKSLKWNQSLYKIYCDKKFDDNLTLKDTKYNKHNIKIPFSNSNGIANTINIPKEISKIITSLFHISNELMTIPLRCIYIICDLNCIYSTQIASSIIESIGNQLPFITRHCIGLVPLGGLNGVSNYGAMFFIYSALISGDSLMVRSLVDAVYLLNNSNGNNNSSNNNNTSNSLENLWMSTAADLLTCCLSWYRDYDTTTSTTTSSGSISGCDFTTLCTTSSNKIVDVRSSLWKRFLPTATTTSKAANTVSNKLQNAKIKGLRDMATNIHSLFAVHATTSSTTGISTSTSISSNNNNSSNSAKIDEKFRTIKQAQLLEMGLQRKSNNSSGSSSISDLSYSIQIRECTAVDKDVNAALLYATPGCQWPVLITNPKSGTSFMHGDLVIMVLQSPFATESVKTVCERAMMLGQRRAFLHYFYTTQRINHVNNQHYQNSSDSTDINSYNNVNIWCREAVVAAQHVLHTIS